MASLQTKALHLLTHRELYQEFKKRLPLVEYAYQGYLSLPAATGEQDTGANPVSDDVRLLGVMLGLILFEHEGEAFYTFIERLRKGAKSARESSGQIGFEDIEATIRKELSHLDESTQLIWLHHAAASFRLFLFLASIAEGVHQTDKRIHKNSDLSDLVQTLKDQETPVSVVRQVYRNLRIRIVATAHPTRILRQSILNHQRDVFALLKALHDPRLTPIRQQELIAELLEKIEVMWATQFSRWTKPTVLDEIKQVQGYFSRTLYPSLSQFHYNLRQQLALHFADIFMEEDNLKPIYILGSWVGGDMDGNPFVTPEVFSDALIQQYRAILKLYREEIAEMAPKLSHSSRWIKPDQRLQESLLEDLARMKSVGMDTGPYEDFSYREPFRSKLGLMAYRLDNTLKNNLQLLGGFHPRTQFVYETPQQLLNDLDLIIDGLAKEGFCRSIHTRLERFKQTIRIFGFHFATIDLREETAHLNLAARTLLDASEIPLPESSELEEQAWLTILTDEILSPKVIHTRQLDLASCSRLALDDKQVAAVERILNMLSVAYNAVSFISPAACENLILTMTHSAEDVLNALLLLKTQGLFYKDCFARKYQSLMNIVPLFETIPDLQNAAVIMETLFQNPAYRQQLACRNNRQLIMLGYSDSNKDGGYFCCNWNLYKTQKHLISVADKHNIELRFFHGRGGNLGRGGAPTQRAIEALPAGSAEYGQDLTEQGEVLSRYYNVPEIALAHIDNLITAVFQKNIRDYNQNDFRAQTGSLGRDSQPPEWEAIAEYLSHISESKYRALIQDNPYFIEYFEYVTPKEVELVKIGSRPTVRISPPTPRLGGTKRPESDHQQQKNRSIKELRAIPWVFRWFQSRQIIPGWFGLGTALESYVLHEPESGLSRLKSMYHGWPFFESLIENSEIGLRQTDISIARFYATLSPDQPHTQEILEIIQEEYERTIRMVTMITGKSLLEREEDFELKNAIELREPYLDPLNYIQVYLLSKYRHLEAQQEAEASPETQELLEEYHRALVASIEGIATGLGTTG